MTEISLLDGEIKLEVHLKYKGEIEGYCILKIHDKSFYLYEQDCLILSTALKMCNTEENA